MFSELKFPSYICRLKHALYGLKQAPYAWFDRLSNFLLEIDFICSIADPSLFICHSSRGTILLLIYVDDMLLTENNTNFLGWFSDKLSSEFAIKDLGSIHYFLSIEALAQSSGLFLCQSKYGSDLLERAQMNGCKPISTPNGYQRAYYIN